MEGRLNTKLNDRIKLTDKDIETFNHGVIICRFTDWPVDLKQQIIEDHEKINRFNQIFSNHKKDGAPTNKPELTGVDQKVIDQIQNIITSMLEYIEDGRTPDGYSSIKKTILEKN